MLYCECFFYGLFNACVFFKNIFEVFFVYENVFFLIF